MAQFDVYRNPNRATAKRYPYLLDAQSSLLADLLTRVVIPLADPLIVANQPVSHLNPSFTVEGNTLILLAQEIAGIPTRQLGERVGSLAERRDEIIRAVDILFSGI